MADRKFSQGRRSRFGAVLAVLGLSLLVFVLVASAAPSSSSAAYRSSASTVPAVSPAAGAVNLTAGVPQPLAPAFFGVDVRVDSPFGATQQQELNETAVRYIVWPGGAIADRYDAVTNQLYSTSGKVSTPSSNEAQFVGWCRSVGCHAILQVPGEIDQPSVAAAEINYTIHTLGYLPDYIEIGNEPALWTHYGTPWANWASGSSGNATPSTYAKIVQRYIPAIRAVDPAARIIGLPGIGQGASGEPGWLSATVQLNGPNLSAVAIHVYPGGSSSPSSPTLSQFFAQLSSSASLPVRVPKDRAAMASACSSCGSIPILVTELGATGGSSSFSTFMSGFPNVPYIATELIQGMELNLTSLDDFAFQNSYAGSWYSSSGTATPTYTFYSTVLPALGGEFVPTRLSSATPGLAVALTQHPSDGSEALLIANTNTSSTRALDLTGLGLPGGPAHLTWWNSSAAAPTSIGVSRVPTTFSVAPDSVGLVVTSTTGSSTGPTDGTIDGRVVSDISGVAVGGAEVVAVSSSGDYGAVSNASGWYTLNLPAGSYSLFVFAGGFASAATNTSVVAGSVHELDFSLLGSSAASYPVTGTVLTSAGTPLAGALVRAGTVGSAVSAADGSFSLVVPNGSYSLSVTRPGYRAESVDVKVAGASVDVGAIPLLASSGGTAGALFPVRGYVYNAATGAWLPSARVFATDGPASISVPVSDRGGWSIELANGSYSFLATATGFTSHSVAVTVSGAPSNGIGIELFPSNSSNTTAVVAPSGGGIPPVVEPFLPFLPSAGVGVVGFVSWRAFLRARPRAYARPTSVRPG